MELHFVVLTQVGNESEDTWNVWVTNKESYDAIEEAIASKDLEAIEVAVAEMDTLDTLEMDCSREEAIQIARDYADSHIVTVYIEVPLT